MLFIHSFDSGEFRPEYCSESEATSEEKIRFLGAIFTFLARDAVGDDQDKVLSVNFTAVGSILLLFVNALSSHMGWSK
jgi:hypothetical protein